VKKQKKKKRACYVRGHYTHELVGKGRAELEDAGFPSGEIEHFIYRTSTQAVTAQGNPDVWAMAVYARALLWELGEAEKQLEAIAAIAEGRTHTP
jgi:hypothetical protein